MKKEKTTLNSTKEDTGRVIKKAVRVKSVPEVKQERTVVEPELMGEPVPTPETSTAVAPATIQFTDLSPQEITELANQVTELVEKAKDYKIVDATTREEANVTLKLIITLNKAIEDKRVAITKPMLDKKTAIDTKFKVISKPLADIEKSLRTEVARDINEQSRLARIEEERLQKIADEKAKEVETQYGNTSNPLLQELVKTETKSITKEIMKDAPAVTTSFKSSVGSSSVRTTKKFRVLDFSKIPDEYKMINESLINQVIRRAENRVTEIAGIEIYDDSTGLTVR